MYAYVKAWAELNATKLKLDERAVTALEYGLIAALIAAVIVTGVTAVGSNVSSTFNKIATSM